MLTVRESHRKRGIGVRLAKMAIQRMKQVGCSAVVLEAEGGNGGALRLYERLGFMREQRMARYYLNGGDAFRLRLDFKEEAEEKEDCPSGPACSDDHSGVDRMTVNG